MESNVTFSNRNFIQGYDETSGSCAGEPIYGGVISTINASAYLLSNCVGASRERELIFCDPGSTIPLSEVSGYFPTGSRFYDEYPVTPGATEYTSLNPFPTTSGTTDYFAIPPASVDTCYFPLSITVQDSPSDLPNVTDQSFCKGQGEKSFLATPDPGFSLLWYDASSGGVGASNAPTVDTETETGIFTKYVSQELVNSTGCESDRVPVTITVNPKPTFTTSKINIQCNGSSDGSITVTPGSGSIGDYQYSKNGGANYQASNIFSGLANGAYSIKIKNISTTCESDPVSVSITEPDVLDATVGSTNVTCNGSGDGTITVSGASGGYGTYEYSIDSGSNWETDGSFTSLAPSTYNVQIRDAAHTGCEITLNGSLEITEPDELTVVLDAAKPVKQVDCNGNSTGTIDITVSGGTTAYGFEWTNNGGTTWTYSTDEDLTGLSAGTYQVRVTDANSCTASLSSPVTITEPDELTVVLDAAKPVKQVDCNGNSTGTIDITVSGGTTAYGFEWTNNGGTTWTYSTDEDLTGLPAGTYQVRVTDANSCTASLSSPVTITEPDELTVVLDAAKPVKQVDCNGNSTGTIDITVSGGTTAYGFEWTNNGGTTWTYSTDEDLTGLPAGTYQVRVTDANSCTASLSSPVTITEPDELTVVLDAAKPVKQVDCNGNSTGTIDITVSGGTTAYGFEWTNNGGTTWTYSTDEDLTGLPAGTYQVRVTDANSCTASLSSPVTITEPDELTVVLDAAKPVKQVDCNGNSTGTIDITVSGGTTAYGFEWTNNGGTTWTYSTDEDLTGLPAGTYQVRVTDANSCTASLSSPVTITEPDELTVVLDAAKPVKQVDCNGNSTGTIDITVSGGTTAYGFEWTNNGGTTWTYSTDEDLTGLPAGTYQVRVTDANSCTASLSSPVTITEPDELTVVLDAAKPVKQVDCNGNSTGTIDITVSGGTTAYGFEWTNNGGTTWTYSTDEDLTGLPAGTYQVRVTDANSCTASLSSPVTITEPDELTVVLDAAKPVKQVDCNGNSTGTIDITVSGGTTAYGFEWTNNGGTTWTYSTDEDLTGLPAGTYQVRVTDANSCTASLSSPVTITEPDELTVVLDAAKPVKQVDCNGNSTGTIDITVSGGTTAYGFEWTNNGGTTWTYSTDEDLTGLPAGTYQVRVTDANSCTASLSSPVTITEPDELTVVLDAAKPVKQVDCNGNSTGTIDITVSGGTTAYGFEWTNNGGTTWTYSTDEDLTGLPAGTYQVRVTDANSCTTSLSSPVTITEPDELTVVLDAAKPVKQVDCNGNSTGTIDITVSGGTTAYGFEWTNNGGTTWTYSTDEDLTGLPAGTYQVRVTDANSCTASLSSPVTITEPDELTVVLDAAKPVKQVDCNGNSTGTIDITVSGGTTAYGFEWTNNGGTTWTYSTDEDLTGLPAGTYQVRVTDANSCTASLSSPVTITEPDELTVVLDAAKPVKQVDCNGNSTGTIDITVSGGTTAYGFEWTNNGGTTWTYSTDEDLTGLPAGTYQVRVTDANSCTASLSSPVTITEPDELTVVLDAAKPVKQVDCNGNSTGTIDITVSGGTTAYGFEWTNNGGTTWTYSTDEDLTGLPAGTYQVRVTDANSCTASLSSPVTITEPDELTVVLDAAKPVKQVDCNGNSTGTIDITVSGGTTAYGFEWTNNGGTTWTYSTDEDLTGLSAGTYQVRVTDANSCTASLSSPVTITEPDELTVVLDAAKPVKQVDCNGNSTGTIDITVSGGTTAYGFEWTNNGGTTWTYSTDEDLTGLPAGTYQVRVTDANSCTASLSSPVTVTEPDELTVVLDAAKPVKQVDCNGNSTGTIDITVSGGTTAYGFEWTNNGGTTWTYSTDEDLTGLPAGTYQVRVTDANSCTASLSSPVTITEPDELTVVLDAAKPVKQVDCNGNSTGTIDITVSGGTTAYGFEWTNNGGTTWTYSTDEDLTGLPAGTYQVRVTDANSCTASLSSPVTITEPDELTVVLDAAKPVKQVDCNGNSTGTIDITVSGGTTAYGFEWTNNGGTTWTYSTDEDLTGLPAGTYQVRVTDANSCTASLSSPVTVTEPDELTVVLDAAKPVKQVDCNGNSTGTIDITVSGGTTAYGFEWTNNGGTTWTYSTDEDLTGLPAGTYQVRVTDANSCTASLSSPVTITEPDELTVVLDAAKPVKQVDCNGNSTGTIDITVSGGTTAYGFEWTNNGGTTWTYSTDEDLTGLPAGTYQVRVTDANSCTASLSSPVTITEPDELTVVLDAAKPVKQVDCNGNSTGTIDITVSGGTTAYGFEWTNNGGTTWTYSTDEDLTGLPAGTYQVRVTDANSCTASLSSPVTITEPDELTVVLDAAKPVKQVDCNGNSTGTIDITVSGGTTAYGFEWTNNGGTTWTYSTDEDLTGLPAGTYQVRVTDANSCTASLSSPVTITEPDELTVVLDAAKPVKQVDCNGNSTGTIDITVSGGTTAYGFEWTNNGGTTWTYSTDEDLTGLPAGTYQVRVTDANSCTASLSSPVTITEPDELTVVLDAAKPVKQVDCNGNSTGTIDITVSGGTTAYGFEWTNNGGTTWTYSTDEDLTGLPAGTYQVRVTDANSCTASLSSPVTITEPDELTVVLDAAKPVKQVDCNGNSTGTIDITVSGGTTAYGFEWTNNGGTTWTYSTDEDLTGLPAGTYQVRVTDANSCTASLSSPVTITEPDELTVVLDAAKPVKQVDCNGNSTGTIDITVSGGTTAYGFEWTNNGGTTWTYSTDEDLTGLPAGTYQYV